MFCVNSIERTSNRLLAHYPAVRRAKLDAGTHPKPTLLVPGGPSLYACSLSSVATKTDVRKNKTTSRALRLSSTKRRKVVPGHPVRCAVPALRRSSGPGPLAEGATGRSADCELRSLRYMGALVCRRSSQLHSCELSGRRMASAKAFRVHSVYRYPF